MSRYAVSWSQDYNGGSVVIRDFASEPRGRVLCTVIRENRKEAEQIGQYICDLLNREEKNDLGIV